MASVRGRSTQLGLWSAFLAGCTVGGAATGAVLGVLSGLLSPVPDLWRAGLLCVLVPGLVLLDLAQPVLRLPQRTELIPRSVFARGLARGGFRFGVEYGCGVRTLVPSAASYVSALFVLVAVVPLGWAVLLGAVFGAARTLAVLQYILLGRPGWQHFLSGHTRALERSGTVVTAALVTWATVLLVS
ncbi:hypothetical protein [Ornithinimicrobium pekingense]|uniref:Urease accessory protein UreH-like transmembrane domain-containing protein n=1 Tax=Ornithinimicrobium pekingense TaxID=384677 RepID=A0ABQ2F3Q1_9MICO|nr:hypothetical protein [Ornithinimicrobium pekingense]GGK58095.1 hypothetical protein GCM10011509_03150 [Ornithinimicrobium pekingense]